MLGIGPWELILILVIILIVFGPGRLPDVARSLGKAVNEFRRASSGVQRMWEEVTREPPKPPAEAVEEKERQAEKEQNQGKTLPDEPPKSVGGGDSHAA